MNLSPYQKAVAQGAYEWFSTARPKQLVDDTLDFDNWLWNAGRGWGKTKPLNSHCWINAAISKKDVAIIAPTHSALRDVIMEGRSGLKNLIPLDVLKTGSWDGSYNKSENRISLGNGSNILLRSGDNPERLRGLNLHAFYLDEPVAMNKPDQVFAMAKMATRLGDNPRAYIATTPKPIPFIKGLLKDPRTHVVTGSTKENEANLAPTFYNTLNAVYGGTRLGRQELEAELLEDFENALWIWDTLDKCKIGDIALPDMQRIVVAVDPSGNNGNKGDATGIVIAGLGVDGQYYVLADRSCTLSPELWAKMAINAYHEFKADKIIAEQNYGGAMVESLLRNIDRNIPYGSVVATRGKAVRAEPIAALYTQGKVSHVSGLEKLESQMTEMTTAGFQGSGSPDRVDALVWAVSSLMTSSSIPIRENSFISLK